MEVGHSILLKYFVEDQQNKPKMAEKPEIPVIKIQNDYQSPPNIEAEVPGSHTIREYDDKNNSSEIKITGAEFTLSPVITVIKKESALTKGDMKLQKVTVTEDISEEESENAGYRIPREVESLTQTDKQLDSLTIETSGRKRERVTEMDGEEKGKDEKKSKIPMLRLRQAVERVKKERQAQKAREQPRRSSIPKLKDAKKAVKRDTSLNFQPKVEDEFDKLYEEIVDNKQKDIDDKLPSVTMEDPEKIETKFEELIHAYDEDEHEKQTVSKISKIPALRRKEDDAPSRLGALIDRAKEKSTKTESKLKDGGFNVTASTIRTKRFSRGNSRDMSKEEQQIEVTETIDIRESGDNDVFETSKSAPTKPERNFRNITKRIVTEHKVGTVETKHNTKDGGRQNTKTENMDRKDGTLNKTKRFNHVVSRETRERTLNRELSRNLEDIKKERIKNGIEDSVTVNEFKDGETHVITTETTVRENTQETPVKSEIIVRDISREMNKDGQNISNTETVTVEELEDGGTRTITTKTTESLKIGTPIITEKIIHNISREISTEGQNDIIKGIQTIEETKDGGSKKITKETYVRENVKGIPVKSERFTRGISREMGNIKQKSSKENATAEKRLSSDENKGAIKKETLKTEGIEKEGTKVGAPVFTKVTRSFSKGRIQNVEMSRTIEWKPADEVKTKNYSRSVSEKVTKKELKDASKWKYEAPTAISNITDVNDKPNVQTDMTNKTQKDTLLGEKIKDTVKDIASKITIKKVTEHKSEEQVTNVEKTTFTLSKSVDLSVDNDFKVSREIGTQMSVDGKTVDKNFMVVKEIGTQMSLEGKSTESPFDRDFKLAKEMNLERKTGSNIDGDFKPSKEFGTQMSVIEKTVYLTDRDSKDSREFGTQMSIENTKNIREKDSNQVSKDNATVTNKASIITDTVAENSEKEYSNLTTQEKDSDNVEVTILKGNVSRLKDKIAKETVVNAKKEPNEELPKKKSVLSKIAIFESLEPKDPHPVVEVPTRKIKCKYVPPNLNRTNSADRPKIVDELLKEKIQLEPLVDTSKVEIGVNYDEITNEPKVVKEYWRTEEGFGQNVLEVNRVITENVITVQTEGADLETAKIIPGTIDFKTEESQIEFAKTIDDSAQNQTDSNQIEIPTILPGRINYETEIGKTKPGKINLNIWSNQVEKNKSSVDKIDFLREESLHEIAQTLPGKVDFKTYGSQVPVSKDLPGNIDFTKDENQVEVATTLPAKIHIESEENKLEQFGVTHTLVGRIDSQLGLSDNLSGRSHGYLVDEVTPLPGNIEFKSYDIQTEVATTLPGKIDDEVSKRKKEIGYTSVENLIEQPKILTDIKESTTEMDQKEVGGKPKPGKINFNLWKNQVEVNKTLVGKTGVKKGKETEIAKALSGRADFKTYDKQVRVTETSPGNNVLYKREYKTEFAKTATGQNDLSPYKNQIGGTNILPGKIEIGSTENVETVKPLVSNLDFSNNEAQVSTVKTLPETVNFSSASSQVEAATILPGKIEFSTLENQVGEPKILSGKIEFETEFVSNESKAEISETIQDNFYFSITENQTEDTLSENYFEKVGKLDLKAWENQVEVNKTLVDKIYVVKNEHLEEIAKTLPGKIDFITYESQVGEAKSFPEIIDFNTEPDKVQITEIKDDLEADENTAEIAKVLPGTIEFDPFKFTPRFNPFPELSTHENKVFRNENVQVINNLNMNVNKVEIPSESDPRESLSDPELVDEDPAVEVNNNSIIGNIKRKLYFITNKSSVQNSTNKHIEAEVSAVTHVGDDNYEKKVDELLTKTYSINDVVKKTNVNKTVSSMSTPTENTFKITAEIIEEPYTDNNKNNPATEYELSDNTNIIQIELTKSERPYRVDDFITSPADYEKNKSNTFVNANETIENEFNFDTLKVENNLTRSAYGADDFKTSTEELKRAKSLAELDLGDVTHGQVKRIVGRIKSVDFSRRESVKTEISIKEMPKKMSVLEKIALFEGKTSRSRYESTTIKTTVAKKNTTPVLSEEVYLKKIEELTTGKTKFGRLGDMLYLPLADGAEMPVLALGTAMLDPRLLPHLIGAAIDMGYRAIDTAYIYGNEKEIGQAIKAKIDDGTVKREDLFIISKLWSTYHRTDLVEVACRASLENMGLDYFDLYLIHNPMSFKEGSDPVPKIATVLQYSQYDYLDAWFGMEGLVSKGLVKSIGISNFNSLQIQRILDKGKLKPVINQVECHPYLSQQRLHTFCTERKITLSCFGVLGSKGTPAEFKNSTTPVIDDALVKVMASGLSVTPAQLLIRYQIECGHNVVVKASSAAHLWDNLQALTFTLDRPQVDALHALNRNKRTFTFKGMGETHKNYPFLAAY